MTTKSGRFPCDKPNKANEPKTKVNAKEQLSHVVFTKLFAVSSVCWNTTASGEFRLNQTLLHLSCPEKTAWLLFDRRLLKCPKPLQGQLNAYYKKLRSDHELKDLNAALELLSTRIT